MLVEVLSRSTRQNDKGSKLTEYLALPSLQEYMLIEQDFVEIQVLRRRNGWRPESYYLGQNHYAGISGGRALPPFITRSTMAMSGSGWQHSRESFP
ncbi:MAG: Uma2 family endonuclease [Thiolinea sp.]